MKIKITPLLFISAFMFAFNFIGEDISGVYEFDNTGSKFPIPRNITMKLNKDKSFRYEFYDKGSGALVTTGKWDADAVNLFLHAEKDIDINKKDSTVTDHKETITYYIVGKTICMSKTGSDCFKKK